MSENKTKNKQYISSLKLTVRAISNTLNISENSFYKLVYNNDKRIKRFSDGRIDHIKTIMCFAISPEPIVIKICRVCGEGKDSELFYHKTLICKECKKIEQRLNRKIKVQPNFRFCKICGEQKALSKFNRNTRVCVSCFRKKQRNKKREIAREKAKKLGRVCDFDIPNGTCKYCGAVYPEKSFSRDSKSKKLKKCCNQCKWDREDKDRRNRKRRIKEKTDPKTRINKLMRNGIKKTLKANNIEKNRRTWQALVDYTTEDLYKHLKQSLKKLNNDRNTSYTWDDFLRADLHIDHIIPIDAFNYDSAEHIDFKRCWALENLQLLPASENISKSNKCDSFQVAF